MVMMNLTRTPSAEMFPPVNSTPPFTLDDLYAFFPDSSQRPPTEPIAAPDVPSPYQQLLVHRHHMTVTVERYFGSPVNVRVLQFRQSGDSYARQILLSLQSDQRVVQFGIVHIDLGVLNATVREEILSGQIPLGRVLIKHDVLRTVEPFRFLKVHPSPILSDWFGVSSTTYGRLGVITADGRPAIRVAEILLPGLSAASTAAS